MSLLFKKGITIEYSLPVFSSFCPMRHICYCHHFRPASVVVAVRVRVAQLVK